MRDYYISTCIHYYIHSIYSTLCLHQFAHVQDTKSMLVLSNNIDKYRYSVYIYKYICNIDKYIYSVYAISDFLFQFLKVDDVGFEMCFYSQKWCRSY